MSAEPPRPSAWRLLVVVVMSTAVGTLGTWMWVRSAIDHRWADLERKIRTLHAEATARSGVRPVLRGQPEPGAAWPKYARAIDLMRPVAMILSSRGFDANREDDWIAAPLKEYVPALLALHDGVGRQNGNHERDWQHAESPREIGSLVFLAGWSVKALREGKEAGAAAERILDVLQFCSDYERNGSWEDALQAANERIAVIHHLRTLILSKELTQAQLLELDRELEALDRAWPVLSDVLINSAMDRGFMLLDLSRKGSLLKKEDGSVSWRFLFSEQVLIAAAFDAELEYMRQLALSYLKPWPESVGIQARALDHWAAVDNAILRRFSSGTTIQQQHILPTHREHRARIRLLRAGAHFLATGEPLELEDPFGRHLLYSRTSNHLKIWSAGLDGIDDGGSGLWEQGKDIVLEVDR